MNTVHKIFFKRLFYPEEMFEENKKVAWKRNRKYNNNNLSSSYDKSNGEKC